MKKNILKLCMLMMLILCFSFPVMAADDNDTDTGKDDLGRVTSGFFRADFDTNDLFRSVDYFEFECNESSYIYLVLDQRINGDYYSLCGQGSATQYYYRGTTTDRTDPQLGSPTTRRIGLNSALVSIDGYLYTKDNNDNTTTVITTNIPIFNLENKEAIQAYEEYGDTSGAINQDDIGGDGFDESIELPVDFKITGGYAKMIEEAYAIDKPISMSWKQTVDTSDYVYEIDVRLTIQMRTGSFGSSHPTGQYYSSDWLNYKTVNYDGVNYVSTSISEDFVNDTLWYNVAMKYKGVNGEGLPYKGYQYSLIEIRIRNRVGGKYSNYVVTKIDKEGTTTTATVQNKDGETVEDENYNGGNVADKNSDTSINSDLSGLDDLWNYIRGGFGLLGSGGIISLMSQVFLYLPSGIWTILYFFVSMVVLVSVIKLIKEVLLG